MDKKSKYSVYIQRKQANEMFDTKKFGTYLSQRRINAGLGQAALAEKVGVAAETVEAWERGKSFPDITLVTELSDALGVSVEALIAGGSPTEGEGEILREAADGGAAQGAEAADAAGVAPLLRPELLDKIAAGLKGQGIDITAVVKLAEYLNDERVVELLGKADCGALDEELLAKLVPFLDEASKAAILEKILDGELDYRFIGVMLPYAEYLIPQVEAAVVYGALDPGVLKILNDYTLGKPEKTAK